MTVLCTVTCCSEILPPSLLAGLHARCPLEDQPAQSLTVADMLKASTQGCALHAWPCTSRLFVQPSALSGHCWMPSIVLSNSDIQWYFLTMVSMPA